MPSSAQTYLDAELPEDQEPEAFSGSHTIFAILDIRNIPNQDVTEATKAEIIRLAIPRLHKVYPWASSITPDVMGINHDGWLMHFKVKK